MNIKKFVVPLAVLACAALIPVKGFAFTSTNKSTQTASVTFTGAGVANMTLTVFGGGNITWPAVSLPVTGNGWVDASKYLVVSATVTAYGGGIQIYTNNAAAGITPQWTGALLPVTSTGTTANNPAGLVSESNTTATLPMAWSATPSTTTATLADEPNNCGKTDPTGTACAWNYMLDKNTPNTLGPIVAGVQTYNSGFANGATYVELYQAGSGLHYDSGPSGFFPNTTAPNFDVFLEANFSNALTSASGITYQTSALVVESFTP
jgi:hypothetical protein